MQCQSRCLAKQDLVPSTIYIFSPHHIEIIQHILRCLERFEIASKKMQTFSSETNATSVTVHRLRQATWGHIWKRTVEKRQSNALVATKHLLVQTSWEHIWHYTVEKAQIHATNVLYIFYSIFFEDSFELTQWRKAKQTHAVCSVTYSPNGDAWQNKAWCHL